MNHELAKTLTTALVQFIDRERPEGSMCCSNTDCENIRAAFEEGEYDCVEAFIQKKLSGLTEFEQEVSDIVEYCKEHGENVAFDYAKRHAKTLLALAKKELARQGEVITLDKLQPYDKGFQDGKAEAMAELERTFECNPEKLPLWLKNEFHRIRLEAHTKGYNKGYKDAEEAYNKAASYQFPTFTIRPLCWEPGGTCTNPQMDCVNCPRKTTGGFNTSYGTSTAKAILQNKEEKHEGSF